MTRIRGAFGHAFARVRRQLKSRLGLLGPARIVAYRGFGTASMLRVRGRVLSDDLVHADPDQPLWKHVVDTLRRLETDEIPGARVNASCRDRKAGGVSDAEGFFRIDLDAPNPEQSGWHDVHLEVIEADGDRGRSTALAQVLVPAPDAEFGVISDIDDTVIRSNVTNRLLFARATLLRNARSRPPFAGVAELYRALEAGPDDRGRNPIFYLSLTAWNLYDALESCLALHDVPLGPLILRDRGVKADVGSEDKVERALELLGLYPDLPFVLIGDSGQGDPEAYLDVLRSAPRRVRAVYIRDVSKDDRDREVRAIARKSESYGVAMILAGDSGVAARHAHENGLITREAAEGVAAAVRAESG